MSSKATVYWICLWTLVRSGHSRLLVSRSTIASNTSHHSKLTQDWNATSQPQVNASTAQGSTMPTIAISASIGGLVLFALLVLVLWLKKKNKREVNSILNWRDLDLLKLPVPLFRLKHLVGSSGSTHLAIYQGNNVVVKTLKANSNDEDIQAFIDEIQFFGFLKCPHVVTLVGVVWTKPANIQAIIEYMNLGDLEHYLSTTDSNSFAWMDKFKCLLHVAKALHYLHSKQTIHRDLKSRNILLDSEQGAKISDFGAAKEGVYDGMVMTAALGSYRWMAPEILLFKEYSYAVDIYSFGVVVSEVSSHKLPYHELDNQCDNFIVHRVLYKNLRPSFGSDCPSWLELLGKRCMSAEPNDRPNAMEVIQAIESQMNYCL